VTGMAHEVIQRLVQQPGAVVRAGERGMSENNPTPIEPELIEQAIRSAGFEPALIDRESVTDKDGLLRALYRALNFPNWFGFNYDALQDALEMLEPVEGRGWVLVFQDFDSLEQHEPDCARIFLDIVRQVADQKHASLHKLMLL